MWLWWTQRRKKKEFNFFFIQRGFSFVFYSYLYRMDVIGVCMDNMCVWYTDMYYNKCDNRRQLKTTIKKMCDTLIRTFRWEHDEGKEKIKTYARLRVRYWTNYMIFIIRSHDRLKCGFCSGSSDLIIFKSDFFSEPLQPTADFELCM